VQCQLAIRTTDGPIRLCYSGADYTPNAAARRRRALINHRAPCSLGTLGAQIEDNFCGRGGVGWRGLRFAVLQRRIGLSHRRFLVLQHGNHDTERFNLLLQPLNLDPCAALHHGYSSSLCGLVFRVHMMIAKKPESGHSLHQQAGKGGE